MSKAFVQFQKYILVTIDTEGEIQSAAPLDSGDSTISCKTNKSRVNT